MAVNRYATTTRQAMFAFDIDAAALGLADDDDYSAFEASSGLTRVLLVSERIRTSLDGLTEGRAA
jgi:hypothetical protein